ncbi:MAG: prepilin-type N-terminal cleavage/methylation domain-containing protein [Proteobacteria bacterium]|nr:prepilin-type N-terminal cleavage/methylation domain-containing protein [Pseudomonadota bacterium]NOG60439.1 prepilin-type N-terminal cleavage/methylation domain-containing protein [Pseudomonadota bacterium]
MNNQKGFTLVEIAIVLVIIGLLLGGILKGQELINSARVRNLADQNSGIQAAYYGFIDRYRQVPGDFPSTNATQALGVTVNLPAAASATDGNGQLDNTLEEAAAVWEQLARSQFLGGGFTPATAVPASEAAYAANQVGPFNAFNGPLVLTRNAGYTGTASIRLNLHMGRNVPVNIARELDVKIDDGLPNTGVLRMTTPATAAGGGTTFDAIEFVSQVAGCTTGAAVVTAGNAAGTGVATDIYDIFDDFQDCPQVFVY